jgi:hypothetical protein
VDQLIGGEFEGGRSSTAIEKRFTSGHGVRRFDQQTFATFGQMGGCNQFTGRFQKCRHRFGVQGTAMLGESLDEFKT